MTSDKPVGWSANPRNPHTEQRLARAAELLAEASEMLDDAEEIIDAERAVIAERFLAERQAAGFASLGFALVALTCTLTAAPGR